MGTRPRKRLVASAAMLSLLSGFFSCSYGDDDEDEKDKGRKQVEMPAPQGLIVSDSLIELGLQAAQQQPAGKAKG